MRHYLERYLYEECAAAENQSGIIIEWIFLNLQKGKNFGVPVSYPNYLAFLKGCARRAGMDPSKIRTHSGRSTKVMEALENGALNPAERKSEAESSVSFRLEKHQFNAAIHEIQQRDYGKRSI